MSVPQLFCLLAFAALPCGLSCFDGFRSLAKLRSPPVIIFHRLLSRAAIATTAFHHLSPPCVVVLLLRPLPFIICVAVSQGDS